MEGSGRCNASGIEIKTLKKYGQIKIQPMQIEELKYAGKTETWIKSKEKIEEMMIEVKKDEKDRRRIPFNITGSRSILFHDERLRIKIYNKDLLALVNGQIDLDKYDDVNLQVYKISQELCFAITFFVSSLALFVSTFALLTLFLAC